MHLITAPTNGTTQNKIKTKRAAQQQLDRRTQLKRVLAQQKANMSSSVEQLQPKSIGREFVRRYYTILNQSPENLHCFYNDESVFVHDDVDAMEQKTISVVGKQAIFNAMKMRRMHYRHRCTIINGIDTATTINNGLVVQVFGEIAHNGERMRPFSQSFILMAVSTLKYYVINEIFRFRDFVDSPKRTISETGSVGGTLKASHDLNATFMDEPLDDDTDDNMTGESICELQTKHLKSILQDSQSKDGRPPNYRKEIESAVSCAVSVPLTQISNETANQLFQDKCIITVGTVINPNINFDDEEVDAAPHENPAEETIQKSVHVENNNTIEENQKKIADGQEIIGKSPDAIKATETTPMATVAVVETKKSYAEMFKIAREKSRSGSLSSRSSSCDLQKASISSFKDKPLIIRNSLRRKSDKVSSSNRGKGNETTN